MPSFSTAALIGSGTALGVCDASADLQAFEANLTDFANHLDFGIINGTLILEGLDGSVVAIPFGHIPQGYKSLFDSNEIGKRSSVLRRLKRLRVPFVYDQSMYVDGGASDIWEVQAAYGFKTGIALRLDSGSREHFLIGVDREAPLPDEPSELARLLADLYLCAAYAQVTALVSLGPEMRSAKRQSSVRESSKF